MANNTCNAVKWEDMANKLDHKHVSLVINIVKIQADLVGIYGTVDELKELKDSTDQLKGFKESVHELLYKQTHEHMDEIHCVDLSQHGEHHPPHFLWSPPHNSFLDHPPWHHVPKMDMHKFDRSDLVR